MTIWHEFFLTDGSDYIDMMRHFHLAGWRPRVTQYKDGGVHRSSPLIDGRQLLFRRWDNVAESIPFVAKNGTEDGLAYDLQRIRRMVESAADFWTSRWNTSPIYVIARGAGETYERYAVVNIAVVPEDDDPFRPDTWELDYVLAYGLTLGIERLPFWQRQAPGTVKPLWIGANQTYESEYFGNINVGGTASPVSANEVYLANAGLQAQLTHVFQDDGGAFSANLIGTTPPYYLLPAVPTTDDAVYFIIDSTSSDPGPFAGIVLYLATEGNDITVTYEYWDGGAWAEFTSSGAVIDLWDNTGGMLIPGVNSINWNTPSDWATTTVNSVTGWAFRVRVTGVGADPIGPVQGGRNPYVVTWPYIEIGSDQVEGDVPALARIRLYNESARDAEQYPQLYADRVILGLRSTDRGADFTPYINLGNTQNPLSIAVAALGAGTTVGSADVANAGSGLRAEWTPGAAAAMSDRFQVKFPSTAALQYYGRFHAFLRVQQSGGTAGDFEIQLRASAFKQSSNLYTQTPTRPTRLVGFGPHVIDLGRITLPPGGAQQSETFETIFITIRSACIEAGGGALYLYDLVLMPVDEWAIDVEEDAIIADTNTLHAENYMDIDSASNPRYYRTVYVPVRTKASGEMEFSYRNINAAPAHVPPRSACRLFILAEENPSFGVTSKVSLPGITFRCQVSVIERYFSIIGAGG